ncbi:MAG: AMP-binding protein [Pseudonocardiales bacterium]
MSGRPLHAVVLPTGPALYDHLRAALGGGPAIMPIDPGLPPPARDQLIESMRPAAVVTAAGEHARNDGLPVAGDVAVVMATSGSTGAPKGVELTGAALQHSARATLDRVGARPGDRWLCCLPTAHVGGLQVLVRSLLTGTDPVMLERFAVPAVAAAVASGAVEHLALVPTTLHRLLDAGVDLSRLRSVLVGGAALSADLLARARPAGVPVVATYGMTETAGGCCYDGLALDGVEVRLDGSGRIHFAGPLLARGYRLRPDLTAGSFVDGWLVTPDVGQLEADGRLTVLGRADDVIVSGGVKVAAGAIADLLATHAAVAEASVLARPDPEWGQRVVAVVVPADPTAPPTLAELRAHVSATRTAAAAPAELVLTDALPVLPSGKIDRLALKGLLG